MTRFIQQIFIGTLVPDTTCFVLADAGWITVGGNPAAAFTDGLCRYPSRTAEGK